MEKNIGPYRLKRLSGRIVSQLPTGKSPSGSDCGVAKIGDSGKTARVRKMMQCTSWERKTIFSSFLNKLLKFLSIE
jgi:hypothetical protein